MDISFDDLKTLPIKRLKAILEKLKKEPKNVVNDHMMGIIKRLIIEKKKKGTIVHLLKRKGTPIHLRTQNG